MNHPNNYISKPEICFILGIHQRSGTNFIFRLLNLHPNCIGPGPIWEDFLLAKSELLKQYISSVYNSWDTRWGVTKKIDCPKEILFRYFGDAISHFLRLQVKSINKDQKSTNHGNTEDNPPKILLTKTPSVLCIDNFFKLFPGAYLIIIIRDGRAVVESGVRSFNWSYERAMREWRDAAQAILEFKEKNKEANEKFIIIKYEDIITEEKKKLEEIFRFLEVDPDLFDFEQTKFLGVTGSCEDKEPARGITWQVKHKGKDFNPLNRFGNWDDEKHERFNWIAGHLLFRFGYDVKETNSNKFQYVIRNGVLDARWAIITIYLSWINIIRKTVHRIRNKFKKHLSS